MIKTVKVLEKLVGLFNKNYDKIRSVSYENPYTNDYHEDLHENEIIMNFENVEDTHYFFTHNGTRLLSLHEEDLKDVKVSESENTIELSYKGMDIVVEYFL
ncbi:MAG: hypothetical protein ACRC7S_07170 [Cetobacterium sp.]